MKLSFLYPLRPVGLALLLTVGLAQAALAQRVFFVRTTGTNANPATATTGWASASPDLGAVLAQARPTDQVWVAGGLYKPSRDFDFGATPTDNRQKTFRILSGVSVYGGFAGTETALSQRVLGSPSSTTLSGDLGGAGNVADNSYHVVTMYGNIQAARLDGLVVTGGNANGADFESTDLDENIAPDIVLNFGYFFPRTTGYGGGVLTWTVANFEEVSKAESVLTNCLLIDNRANYGGGLCTMGLANGEQTTQLTNCQVLNNTAQVWGGGLLVLCRASTQVVNFGESVGLPVASTTKLTMTDCLIAGNTAASGAGLTNTAKGLFSNYASQGKVTITNQVTVTRCVFRDNVTPGTTGGAGVFNQALTRSTSNPSFVNCLFATNSGGGFVNLRDATSVSSPLVTNCTFARNTPAQRGFYNIAPATARLRNCLLYADGSGTVNPFSDSPFVIPVGWIPVVGGSGTASVEYSLIEAQTAVGTNPSGLGLNATTFIDAANSDYRLRLGSRAIDAGDPATNTGTVGAVDLVGNPRIRDGRVDVGAYEYTPPRSTPARVYVRQGASGTANGTSWTNAYPELWQALNQAVAGDEIWVAAGLYKPTGTPDRASTDRTATFGILAGMKVYGGFAGTETDLSQRALTRPASSTLSGNIGSTGNTADNSRHVVSFARVGTQVRLDGFVVTAGNADLQPDDEGGGLYIVGNGTGNVSSPTIANCLITNNLGESGAAVYCNANPSGVASPTFINCLITGNRASFGGAFYNDGRNGGQVNIRLYNCGLTGNVASQGGVARSFAGTSVFFGNCTLRGNQAFTYGGVFYGLTGSAATLTNSLVRDNRAGIDGAIDYGDGTLTATYTDADETLSGSNNRVSDPQFASSNATAPGYLTPGPGSPAIDTGNPASTTTATDPTGGTMLALPLTDLLGNARLVGGRIDRGAVEFQGSALPVTLRYFSGRMTESGALLGWATARETDNAYFQIERSRNVGPGFGFESIATIPTQAVDGNSITELIYSYLDAQQLPGTNYYRLVQTDRDGTKTTHNIIALSRDNAPSVLYPNPIPASGEALIEPGIAHTGYQISDGLGRIVQRTDTPGLLGRVSLAGLPAGVYVLHVQTADGGVRTWRILR